MDYETWRLFLEEFAWRKRIHHDFMLDKLAQAGKPSQYQVQNVSLPYILTRGILYNFAGIVKKAKQYEKR